MDDHKASDKSKGDRYSSAYKPWIHQRYIWSLLFFKYAKVIEKYFFFFAKSNNGV